MDHVFWCNKHDLLLPDIVRGAGCYLYDRGGRKYLDLESGVWCTPLGHSHRDISRVIETQAKRLIHSGYCYSHAVVEEASKALLDASGLVGGQCVFLSSGSEAVEFGVQVMRKITEKPLLFALADSFLGSYGSAGRKPADEWFLFDWTRCRACGHSDACDPACPHLSEIPFEKIGGFVFEPGSASGLVRFPPGSMIRNVVENVRRRGGLLQINEITTGMGRSGAWFGFQHYGLGPDIVSLGKGLGNGYPVSAIAMSADVIDALKRGGFYYFQSHQGDPLGCAVAGEVVRVLNETDLVEKGRRAGAYLLEGLLKLKDKYAVIREVRGKGLMIAVEFRENLTDADVLKIAQRCIREGYILAKRPGLKVFRIDPPLIIDQDDMDLFLTGFDRILSGMAGPETMPPGSGSKGG
jgi:acetylornithine aminotransferase